MATTQIPLPTTNPNRRSNIKLIQAEVEPELHATFREECKRQGTTMQNVVRFYVNHWLGEMKSKRGKKTG